MKVVFVGSEATPFAKTGGLADVLGSLPRVLSDLGHDVRVILPKHAPIRKHYNGRIETLGTTRIPVHDKEEYAGYQTIEKEGVTYFFIDNEFYFGRREHLYGDFDDGERYGFFNRAVLALIEDLNLKVDILHLHDWQCGLIPYIIKHTDDHPRLRDEAKMIFTIHNIAYQGVFEKDLLPYLHIPDKGELHHDEKLNFMKTALVTADFVTTVSPTYADELTYAYYGEGMERYLSDRRDTFQGILNGIDHETFNPKTDPAIKKKYDLSNYLKGKSENKRALFEMFHLPHADKPVFGIVSRLAEQKGFSLLKDIVPPLLKAGRMRLVVLGEGDAELKDFFEYLKREYRDDVGLYFGFSDKIARQIYAGSDFFLMPSRFEPCGLAQLISMRYGTLPVVRKTGGLKDSVEPFNRHEKTGEGFAFLNYDADDLAATLEEALEVYGKKNVFKAMVRRAMKKDQSWEKSAQEYHELYMRLKGGR